MTEDRKNELMAKRFALAQQVREVAGRIENADVGEDCLPWYGLGSELNDAAGECDAIAAGIETAK